MKNPSALTTLNNRFFGEKGSTKRKMWSVVVISLIILRFSMHHDHSSADSGDNNANAETSHETQGQAPSNQSTTQADGSTPAEPSKLDMLRTSRLQGVFIDHIGEFGVVVRRDSNCDYLGNGVGVKVALINTNVDSDNFLGFGCATTTDAETAKVTWLSGGEGLTEVPIGEFTPLNQIGNGPGTAMMILHSAAEQI
ncbi:hypothetical protein [Burkholderia multivorans]|uniref:hypothetical protein n=1 Tax=Burkholderia multivorans TaxID=87883 RepID=UPI0021BFC7E4|nr:hypothetical protein [Burkholderia multivorans]